MSYVCAKALRISGVDYAPGDAIPDGAIRPEMSTGGKKKAATGGKKSTKGNAEDKAKDTAEK